MKYFLKTVNVALNPFIVNWSVHPSMYVAFNSIQIHIYHPSIHPFIHLFPSPPLHSAVTFTTIICMLASHIALSLNANSSHSIIFYIIISCHESSHMHASTYIKLELEWIEWTLPGVSTLSLLEKLQANRCNIVWIFLINQLSESFDLIHLKTSGSVLLIHSKFQIMFFFSACAIQTPIVSMQLFFFWLTLTDIVVLSFFLSSTRSFCLWLGL